jgi:hypothetical protein
MLKLSQRQLVAADKEPAYAQADMKTLHRLVKDDTAEADCYKPSATDFTLAGGMPPDAQAAMVCDWITGDDTDPDTFTYSAAYALMPTVEAADRAFNRFDVDGTFLSTRISPVGQSYSCDLSKDEFSTWIAKANPDVDQGHIGCLDGYSGPSLMTFTYTAGRAVAALVATRNFNSPTEQELRADRKALWEAFKSSDTGFDVSVKVP